MSPVKKRHRFLVNSYLMLSLSLLSGCVETFDFSNFVPKASQGDVSVPVQSDVVNQPGVEDMSAHSARSPSYIRAPRIHVKSEKLLDEDGEWNLVEQSQSYDPAAAHMAARQKVNRNRRKNMSELSAHFKPDAKSGEDGTMRVLRLDNSNKQKLNQKYDDLEVADRVIVQPSKMVEGSEAIGQAKAFFGGHSTLPVYNVRPLRKPKREISITQAKPSVIERGNISSDIVKVRGLRAGSNESKVRLVIDIEHVTQYKVAIDTLRNVLQIKLDHVDWVIEAQGNNLSTSNVLFGSYITREQSEGSVLLEIRLKHKATVMNASLLKPNQTPYHRIVVDLKKE